MALSCDIRIAARGIKLGMPPAKLGLIYSHTGLQKFIEVCGVANTNELFFVGRNVDADRGYEMGLVNAVVEPDELEQAGLDLAAEIGANAPLSLAGNKRVISELRDASRQAARGARERARRAARELLPQRGLPRGRAGVRREAQARVEGPLARPQITSAIVVSRRRKSKSPLTRTTSETAHETAIAAAGGAGVPSSAQRNPSIALDIGFNA